MKLSSLILIFCFVQFSLLAESIDLNRLWKEAGATNPDFLYAKAELDRAIFENEKSYAGYLPTVNVVTSARRSSSSFSGAGSVSDPALTSSNQGGNNTDQNSGSSSRPSEVNRYSVGLTTNQNLFAGFRDKSTIERTEALVAVAKQTLKDTMVRISFELRTAYAQLLFSKQSFILAKKIYERRKKNRDLVGLRYEVGREHKGSFLLSESFVNQSDYEVKVAERLFESNTNEIERILSSKLSLNLNIEFFEETLPTKEIVSSKLEVYIAEHPALMAEQAKVRAAQAGIGVAESGFYPDLSLSATVTRQDDVWLPKPRNYSFGLNLTYPLFNGGRDYYNVKIARSEYEKAVHTRDSKKNSLLYSLQQSFFNYKNSIDQLEVLNGFYLAAETRAVIARSQYSNGLISFENWDIIENDLISREKNLLQGKRESYLNFAILQRNMGKIFGEE
ncbi:TolC family protein [Leptospira sp. 96542]|nr:TolC family protein [Leptospira sp. 96542]